MPAVLDIRLLGSVELRLGGSSLAPPESARAVSLLGLSARPPRRAAVAPAARVPAVAGFDRSAGADEPAQGVARAAPRAARRATSTATRRRWPGGRRPFTLDLAAFEDALDRDDLRAAVEAYGGDLLDGSYDEWVLSERERLRDRYADALERLTAGPGGLEYAERLVRLDPLREAGPRALMRLHAANGDRVRAMRAYHAYAALAQRELGIVPPPDLRVAYEALLDDRPPAPSARTPPLIGRTAERERLRALWHAAASGHAQLALVTGEPGIGKTRLVEDLRAICGAASAEARAYAAEGSVAYGPVVAWLRSDALAPRLRRLDPAHAAELARLLPELAAPPGLAATSSGLAAAPPGLAAAARRGPAARRRARRLAARAAPASPPRRTPPPRPAPRRPPPRRRPASQRPPPPRTSPRTNAARGCSPRSRTRCSAPEPRSSWSPTTCSTSTCRRCSSCTTCCARGRRCWWRRPRGARSSMPGSRRPSSPPRCRRSGALRRSRSRGSAGRTAAGWPSSCAARPSTTTACTPRPRATRCTWSRPCRRAPPAAGCRR